MALKILCVITSMETGGAEKQMVLVLSNLQKEGFEPRLCLFKQTGELLNTIPGNIKIYNLEKKSRWSAGNLVRKLSRLIRQEKPDIVYSREQYANSISSLAIKLSGNKRVAHIANEETMLSGQFSESRIGQLSTLWIRNRYRNIDCIVAPCEASRQDLISRFGLPESRVQVIYNSIDIEALRRIEVLDVPNAPIPYGKPKIISVGSLYAVKGHRFLLTALKEVLRHYPDCQLEILGEGHERASLIECAKELGIESHVHMPGIRVPYTSVAAADVFVLPSLREGIPAALLEAMALRVPVIASSVGGVPEIVEDDVNGFLVSPGNWQEIADRILDLLNDRSKRELFVANGLKVVAEKFDVKKNVKKLEEIFLDLATG
jgi:glycosyltransferase involved in cell wall biosynthesis